MMSYCSCGYCNFFEVGLWIWLLNILVKERVEYESCYLIKLIGKLGFGNYDDGWCYV